MYLLVNFRYMNLSLNTCFFQMKRQQRKLNFLITQTELYAHFMARKITGASEKDRDTILGRLEEKKSTTTSCQHEDYGEFSVGQYIAVLRTAYILSKCMEMSIKVSCTE